MNYSIDKCRLCLQEGKLLKSHIIPEFIYKPIYSETHKTIKVAGGSDGPHPELLQKGLREKILCGNCEKFLNDNYERPSAEVWRVLTSRNSSSQIAIREITDDKSNRALIVSGFDYTSFKLFLLSILWRISVSHLTGFQNISLGPHEEIVRRRLLSIQPGTQSEYPCIVSVMDNSKFTPIAVPPRNPRHEGHRIFRIILTNVLLWFVISKHSQRAGMTPWSLKEDGSLIAALLEPSSIKLLHEIVTITKACHIPEYMFSK